MQTNSWPDEQHRGTIVARLGEFQSPVLHRSLGQAAVTFGLYLAILAAMYASTHVSAWLTLLLAVPAGGFVIRLFIIQHDCGHGSYFRSRRGNAVTGALCSLATFTPYADWRRQHATHHVVWNNLDARPSGADIYSSCLTLREYQALRPGQQLVQRVLSHPLVAQVVLPPLIFLGLYRIPFDTPAAWGREQRSVWLTNLGLLCWLGGLGLVFGFWTMLLVQVPIIVVASIVGVWLFSVQHRFEDSQWAREAEWTQVGAAVHGCSWLRMPRVLQWFTGNIGFHHVHHLMPRVPNYRLQACHEATSLLSGVTALSLGEALRAPGFALWDEEQGRMVPFPARRARRSASAAGPLMKDGSTYAHLAVASEDSGG